MPRQKSVGQFRNRLLSAMSPADLARIEPHLDRLELDRRKRIEIPNRRIETVYFPENGIVSVVAQRAPDVEIEIGLIGREGMTGLAIVLGDDRSPHATYVQVAGDGLRLSASVLRSAIRDSIELRDLLLRFAQTFMVQTAQTAVANAKATVEERLARWVLMAHDRTDGNQIALTHEFLALMLGTRRPGVTDAIHRLNAAGMLQSVRGAIIVHDRKALERRAGRYYGLPEAEYERLLG